jgi:hypothetical protein
MDFMDILGIVIMVVGVIIGLIVYNAFAGALDCTDITDAGLQDACEATKSNANLIFGIIPVFIILGLIPLIRSALSRGV